MDVKRDKKPDKRAVIIRSAVAAAVVGSALLALSQMEPAARVSRASAWFDTVRRGSMAVQVRGAGVLVPEDARWIAAAADGRVDRVLVQPGSSVAADTVIVEISNGELQQAAREAQLQLGAARAELEARRLALRSQLLAQQAVEAAARAEYEEARARATADEELATAGLTSALARVASTGRAAQLAVKLRVEQERLALAEQSARAGLTVAQASVEELEALRALKDEQVGALRVRAGMAGILQQVAVEPGQRVSSGTNLARVAAPAPLKAVIQVSQVEAAQVALRQAVEIDTHAGVVRGVVSRIDPAVQNGSVTIDVRLPHELLANARPDLSVDARIDIERLHDVLFVGRPVQAEGGGRVALFRVAKDGKSATRVIVRTGRASFNAIEVVDGLAEGDRVILSDMSRFDGHDTVIIRD